MLVISQVVVSGLNHLVAQEHWAQERLRVSSGAKILLEAGLARFWLAIDDGGRFALVDETLEPSVTLSLPADIGFKLLFDREHLFSAVRIEGSVDVAETLAFVFRNLRWDIEADLAKVLGDIAAHRMIAGGRSFSSAFTQAVSRVGGNVVEYLRDESAMLPSNTESNGFMYEVNRLRDDVARLEKRLNKLV